MKRHIRPSPRTFFERAVACVQSCPYRCKAAQAGACAWWPCWAGWAGLRTPQKHRASPLNLPQHPQRRHTPHAVLVITVAPWRMLRIFGAGPRPFFSSRSDRLRPFAFALQVTHFLTISLDAMPELPSAGHNICSQWCNILTYCRALTTTLSIF